MLNFASIAILVCSRPWLACDGSYGTHRRCSARTETGWLRLPSPFRNFRVFRGGGAEIQERTLEMPVAAG